MISITGRTFDHRDTLLKMGGRWNNADREWQFTRLSDANIDRLRGMVGLIVVDSTPAPTAMATEVIPSRPIGPSVLYGDDPTYFNYFAPQNPRAFFGFSTLRKFTDYIANLPRSFQYDERRSGWDRSSIFSTFSGTASVEEAVTIARQGWQNGAERAGAILDRLDLANPRQRRRTAALAGGMVNMGRLLSGDPLHMISRPKQPGKKIVTFFVEAGASSLINAETLIARAAIVGAMVDIMENRGYSCTVVAIDTSEYRLRTEYQLTVTLKEAGERLNLGDLIFALGHPSFMRRFSFVAQSSAIECRESWLELGSPANAFNERHPCASSEFYVPVIENNVDIDPLSILSDVIPDRLPITIAKG